MSKELEMAETPDVLARRWFKEVWDDGDESAIDRLMHPQALVHGLGAAPIRGPEQFKPFFRVFHRALGNIKIDIAQTVVQGDTCAVHCHVVARHVGSDLGGPASGALVDFWGITILRADEKGRIVEGWNTFDFLTMYQQIGWVSNPVLPRQP
jgi:predicted SnoaL-like aldol condensation-catalyzing enzyme